ncbi:cysteine--tRNA ligase [Paremcibacter congregatus]|uniref:Cysteine--tRNA ligase n=1 Tax=Paremcibacter congregatus TaxID=2043170 RepID=A0A2G4YUS1_9PROT|nr:cysteine--tRNA ligase [Paremcibacter congregatus]PHZ86078.1 cysteine--tRNA ligase [Paremcibacter congregatus]QDE27044.1 cysteine--tRNA ligase [Paremcibacter congregatus]
MTLKLFNTLSKQKETFTPIDPDHVTIYVCGPTVYNFAHVGNARPVVVFDQLVRLLRHDYPKVTYARNITDIDDKIIEASQESGVSIGEITEKYTRIYEADMGALNTRLPDIRPKATEYIPQMIKMTADLIAKGHAYEKDGHVLFSVASMENYGELSGRKLEDMLAGARVDVASYKKDAGDFILWKPSTDAQPGWDSPWGRGRPGWHLECSCMIEDNFGTTIDIHGGGLDLIFPHHENEIAQSRCAHDGAALANYWMHNGYLTVDGEKMSKSLGNFVTVHELLEEFPGKGEAIRMCLLSAHYRQPVDFSRDGIAQAERQLKRWYRLIKDGVNTEDVNVPDTVLEALRDDLNTPKALAELNKLAKNGVSSEFAVKQLKIAANLFGLLEQDPATYLKTPLILSGQPTTVVQRGDISGGQPCVQYSSEQEKIDGLVAERTEAKKNNDFTRADEIRAELTEQGIVLLDKPDGTTDWERK